MIEACIVLSSHLLCRTTDLRGADSLVLDRLRYLANHGYPFAKAKVWVWEGEYIAIVERGRFYVLRRPVVVGPVSYPFLRWFLKGAYGKAFNLSYLRERSEVASFYGVDVSVLRRGDEVVLKFGGGEGEVGGEVRGGRDDRITGGITIKGRNLFASGVVLSLFASFDSLDMVFQTMGDVPPLLFLALKGEMNLIRVGDSLHYAGLLLPYLWAYPFRFGVGGGYSTVPFVVGYAAKVGTPSLNLLLMASNGSWGYRASLRYGWVSAFAFRGVGGWRERVGGMDRFRRFPPTGYLSGSFAVLRLDARLLRLGRLSVGPFGDVLLEEGSRPLYAYGLSLGVGDEVSLFVSADGYVGLSVKALSVAPSSPTL